MRARQRICRRLSIYGRRARTDFSRLSAVAWLMRWGLRAVIALGLALITLIVGGAYDARIRHPDLKAVAPAQPRRSDARRIWTTPSRLPTTRPARTSSSAEIRAFESTIDPLERTPVNRYHPGSLSHPSSAGRDWNRSFETKPATIRGGALLDPRPDRFAVQHARRRRGAERDKASIRCRCGCRATAPFPSGLVRASWKDWLAAVRVGVRHVRASIPPDAPAHPRRLFERRRAGLEVHARGARRRGARRVRRN